MPPVCGNTSTPRTSNVLPEKRSTHTGSGLKDETSMKGSENKEMTKNHGGGENGPSKMTAPQLRSDSSSKKEWANTKGGKMNDQLSAPGGFTGSVCFCLVHPSPKLHAKFMHKAESIRMDFIVFYCNVCIAMYCTVT